jgi:centromere protein F
MTESLRVSELDLVMVRSEKENLTMQLQEKQGEMLELDRLLSSLKSLLEEKEQQRIQMKEESKAAMELLHTQLKELNEEIAALVNNQETQEAKEQSLDLPGEEVHQLRSSVEKLKVCIEADEKKQLHILQELKESQHHAVLLKDRVENLERELELSGKNQECVILEAEKSKAARLGIKSC